MTTEEYAKEYLFREIQLIESSEERLNALPELTVYEKAIIFKYSDDGYEALNEKLRISEGKDISTFGKPLDECLNKLRDYEDVVYRGQSLANTELERYYLAWNNKKPSREYHFASSSRSRSIAYEWCREKNKVLFEIFCFNGKEIELASKYPAEKEILFRYNTDFRIDNFTFDEDKQLYLITLTEL